MCDVKRSSEKTKIIHLEGSEKFNGESDIYMGFQS